MMRILASVLLLASAALHAQAPVEGTDYERFASPPAGASGPIEVVEVFSYTCPYCASLEPVITTWSEKLPDDVAFSQQPVPFGNPGEAYARGFYAAQAMGSLKPFHEAMFRALHVERRAIRDAEDVAAVAGEAGLDRDAFLATMQSFAVNASLARARQAVSGYAIAGTPTLIVAGKYRVNVPRQGGFERMLQIADALLAQEREARGG